MHLAGERHEVIQAGRLNLIVVSAEGFGFLDVLLAGRMS